MIPATSFLLDSDTALMVTGYLPVLEHRPCDHCQPTTSRKYPRFHPDHCSDCDGTGRHTFDIEVETGNAWLRSHRIDTFRVHVIDVVPIVSDTATRFTLPPDAAPGKWLVRLAVHQ